MKVTTWIEEEIEVEVPMKAITDALLGSGCADSEYQAINGIANSVKFMQAIPDQVITSMNPGSRDCLANHLQNFIAKLRTRAQGQP